MEKDVFLKHTDSEVMKILKFVIGNKSFRGKNLYMLIISNQKEHSAAQSFTWNSFFLIGRDVMLPIIVQLHWF